MQQVRVPWGKWYEESYRELEFPDGWNVSCQQMTEHRALSAEEICEKLEDPIGTEPLHKLAQGKKSACIIVDDISRPTPGSEILPLVIQQLHDAGIDYQNIKVLIALGGHRPMTKKEMGIKVGSWVLEHVLVLNHSPFAADLVTIPDDHQLIQINRNFMEADLRLAIGCIEPHTLAGFSGGAKAVIPGIGGIETLRSNHSLVFADKSKSMSFKNNTCNPENPMRHNMEQIVGKVGLHFIINVVLNRDMKIAGLFCGDYIKAHRQACVLAKNLLRTELVPDADVLVLSAYPKDTEYQQIGTCFTVLGEHKVKCVKKDGTIVVMSAASEGPGFHYLFGPGMPLFSPHEDNIPPQELRGIQTLIYSDGVTSIDIDQFYRGHAPEVYSSWDQILSILEEKYRGRAPRVAVYPMGAIGIGSFAENDS